MWVTRSTTKVRNFDEKLEYNSLEWHYFSHTEIHFFILKGTITYHSMLKIGLWIKVQCTFLTLIICRSDRCVKMIKSDSFQLKIGEKLVWRSLLYKSIRSEKIWFESNDNSICYKKKVEFQPSNPTPILNLFTLRK